MKSSTNLSDLALDYNKNVHDMAAFVPIPNFNPALTDHVSPAEAHAKLHDDLINISTVAVIKQWADPSSVAYKTMSLLIKDTLNILKARCNLYGIPYGSQSKTNTESDVCYPVTEKISGR